VREGEHAEARNEATQTWGANKFAHFTLEAYALDADGELKQLRDETADRPDDDSADDDVDADGSDGYGSDGGRSVARSESTIDSAARRRRHDKPKARDRSPKPRSRSPPLSAAGGSDAPPSSDEDGMAEPPLSVVSGDTGESSSPSSKPNASKRSNKNQRAPRVRSSDATARSESDREGRVARPLRLPTRRIGAGAAEAWRCVCV
jgi:hypothetical protein